MKITWRMKSKLSHNLIREKSKFDNFKIYYFFLRVEKSEVN